MIKDVKVVKKAYNLVQVQAPYPKSVAQTHDPDWLSYFKHQIEMGLSSDIISNYFGIWSARCAQFSHRHCLLNRPIILNAYDNSIGL